MLAVVIALLSFVLNSLVVKYYIKSKNYSRPYILTLVGLDLISILFAMVPYVALSFINDISIFLIVLNTYVVAVNISFGLYLYPALFLAVDRFVVVIFPLKFRELKEKTRCFKVALFGTHFVVAVTDCVLQIVYKYNSFPSLVIKSVASVMNFFELLSVVVMYSTMVVMIIKTNREMAAARQTGTATNE